SPDFGWRGVLDRLSQLDPKVLIHVDGYTYGGRSYDRTDEVRAIVAGLPGLSHVIQVAELFNHPPVDEITFEQVPFDHPLWTLFSSGTTGRPKAIVHGHGGILLEQLKLQALHMDLRPGDPVFF